VDSDTPDPEQLLEAYYEAAASEENTTVEQFVRGMLDENPTAAPALDRFLDRLEAIVLGNIEEKLQESPGAGAEADAAVAATRAELNRARELVLPHL
jgi:hypothetical protein